MSSEPLLRIAKLLLPEVLVTYFELIKNEVKSEEFKDVKLHSKGFFAEATVQDFPIRGKNVYLHITRRRWFDPGTNKVITRDWNLVAKGTRITSEFAAFLKEVH